MNGATNSAVPSALAMATLLGASSPKTTCKKVIVPKAAAKAMTWMVPSGTPSGSSSGWRKWAKAGSSPGSAGPTPQQSSPYGPVWPLPTQGKGFAL